MNFGIVFENLYAEKLYQLSQQHQRHPLIKKVYKLILMLRDSQDGKLGPQRILKFFLHALEQTPIHSSKISQIFLFLVPLSKMIISEVIRA